MAGTSQSPVVLICDDEPQIVRALRVLLRDAGYEALPAYTGEANLHAQFVPLTAQTRMSGVNFDGRWLRKGAGDAVITFVTDEGGRPPAELQPVLDRIGREGGTPLAVARDSQVMGVIYLKETIKQGMSERFDHLRPWASARS